VSEKQAWTGAVVRVIDCLLPDLGDPLTTSAVRPVTNKLNIQQIYLMAILNQYTISKLYGM